MTYKRLTKDELRTLTVKQIKAIDITDVDYEKEINEVLNEKAVSVPPIIKFAYKTHDPKSPAEEAQYQKVVDEFVDKNTPVEAKIVAAEKTLAETNNEILVSPVVAPTTVTKIDLASFKCDQCDKEYTGEVALKVHKTKAHKVKTN